MEDRASTSGPARFYLSTVLVSWRIGHTHERRHTSSVQMLYSFLCCSTASLLRHGWMWYTAFGYSWVSMQGFVHTPRVLVPSVGRARAEPTNIFFSYFRASQASITQLPKSKVVCVLVCVYYCVRMHGSIYFELCRNGSSNQFLNEFEFQDNLTIRGPRIWSPKIPYVPMLSNGRVVLGSYGFSVSNLREAVCAN